MQKKFTIATLFLVVGTAGIFFQNCGQDGVRSILNSDLNQPSVGSTGETVTLKWDANSETDLKEYRIYYGTDSNNMTSQISNVGLTNTPAAPTYTVSNLAKGSTYYFVVVAINNAGLVSPSSNMVSKQL